MTSQPVPKEPVTLAISRLRKSYPSADGELVVLAGIDLEMKSGQALAITGPSGSGKSTLLHIVGGLDVATSGQVLLGDRSIADLAPAALAEYRNRFVGFVFQDHHLLPQCTVLENVLIPTLPAGGANEETIERARGLVDRVGLSSRIGHRPAQLSGGERQRVAIARALINSPPLLLCDEPTGNLDRPNALRIGQLLISLAQDFNAILMIVTHSAELAESLPQQGELRDGFLVPMTTISSQGGP
ncbi:ABC transporter ATP-binding protein [bacterium]|jgi:lipoprotein-releasing system ATP-binding protein|nr:ABC transporter ATP-binding protein [bacterium]